MPGIRHIVMITWKNSALRSEIEDWISFCNRIPQECSMVRNWLSGPCITGPDPDKPSTHDFGILFDLPSDEEWEKYLRHPFPELVYNQGLSVIDLERTASTNMRLL